MLNLSRWKLALAGVAGVLCAASGASAEKFSIPPGDLSAALDAYTAQTGIGLVVSTDAVKGIRTKGIRADVSPNEALEEILSGTGFVVRHEASAIAIVRGTQRGAERGLPEEIAATAASTAQGASLETVTVTSSKIGGDVQNIPISITALSQEQLTATQTTGGPDLIKQVPNMTFTKTNFSGYSIQIRGIGTQAISVTTDPAVAVAFNDIPFIRNHFFEQEFYDVAQVEVLRGPQGTLYGRNATAGVVNLISAKPSDQFEAMASADIGNYENRRLEGMINIPIVDDRFDLRLAGEWTKRNGYTEDTTLGESVDGRDLWSVRATLGWKPNADLQTYLTWEHFSEDDDRLRTSKQLCETVQPPTSVDGVPVPPASDDTGHVVGALAFNASYLSQSCQPTSLYSAHAFEVPYGPSLPYVLGLQAVDAENTGVDPYAETTQSRNLREIQSAILPRYQAKNDTLEFSADYKINSTLTLTSQTGYNQDFLYSTEDYNRFDTSPGVFKTGDAAFACGPTAPPACVMDDPAAGTNGIPADAVMFCDPQLGCSDRLIVQDLDVEHAWQLNQEFRLTSNFSGPFNFSFGGNYLHYETEENYYVFSNAFTILAADSAGGGGCCGAHVAPNCLEVGRYTTGYQSPNPISGGGQATQDCVYYDANPIGSLDDQGHNYFLSQNPYTLNSYAAFGEATYSIFNDLKLTGGLRWTVDQKHFLDIPSELADEGYGYFVSGVENQEWDRFTGRAVLNWTPKLGFTDQTLVYGSYAHGYKAGGANPPGAIFPQNVSAGSSNIPFVLHPLTFKPEYIEAFELGTKNTLLDGALTFNGDLFYYNYTGYQISEIVDRTAINNNYNAHVEGAEIESSWEPLPGLRFNFAGGWEKTAVAGGTFGIDLMDRTAGTPGWMVVKPFADDASNCILPDYVVAAILQLDTINPAGHPGPGPFVCQAAYTAEVDPVTTCSYVPDPTTPCHLEGFNSPLVLPPGYQGFNPLQAGINNGEGFAKNLSGNELPNAPPLTVSFGAQYTLPITQDWAGTLRADYYWQDYSWARVFNDNPYDRLRGYTNVNLTLIFTNQDGWQVMGYLKNVFNTTDITGDFLNSDDSGLTTNVFLTDPRLIGIRVTKNW
jgi:iron complex outermembrane receptor protein